MVVEKVDDDFIKMKEKLMHYANSHGSVGYSMHDLSNSEAALKAIVEDLSFSDALNNSANTIRTDALSPRFSIDDLALLAISEIRINEVDKFIGETFSMYKLRERQGSKVRYEVNDDDIKISTIFSSIETNKLRLRLEDYGVSQTSLEQVFNTHAAEAEQQKVGRLTYCPAITDSNAVNTCHNTETIVRRLDEVDDTRGSATIKPRLSLDDTNADADSPIGNRCIGVEVDQPYDESSMHIDDSNLPFDELYI
jgi:hypothetical protein